jgi:hypothetical protein
MKRKLNITVIIIILSFFSGSVFSQNIQQQTASHGELVEVLKPKKEKPKKEKVISDFTREKGVYIRPEIGVGGMLGNRYGNLYSPGGAGLVDVNVGYQLLPSLAIGGGIGFHFAMGRYTEWYYEYNEDMGASRHSVVTKPYCSIPIYANLRWYMTNTKVQPYLDIKLGYLIGVKSALVDVSRTYTEVGVPATTTSGSYSGVRDTWYQYDDYAKMQGFHGTLAIGFSVKNGFGMCLEASMVRMVYNSEKTLHKEFRTNGMPEWEYDEVVGKSNSTTSVSHSDNYAKMHGMIALKLEYNIPISKKD